jgi:hypothetical protein
MPKPKFKKTMEVSEVTGPVSDLEACLVLVKCFQRPTVAHESSHRPETTSAAVSGVDLGLLTFGVGCVSNPTVDSSKLSASSRFVFPPLPTLSLDAPPAPVGSVVGFGFFDTSFAKQLRWCLFDPSAQT